MKRRLARWMRRTADRWDRAGAPKCSGLSFTFERGVGSVLHGELCSYNPEQPGCLLWYLNDEEYSKAYSEAVTPDSWRGVAAP